MTPPVRRSALRGAVLLVVALVAAFVGLLAPPSAGVVAAATADLTLVADARYEVQPDRHLVHVSLDVSATNHKADTAIRRYYFDRAYLAVLPKTTHFTASASGAKPSVSVSAARTDYTLLLISFGRRVYSNQTYRFQLAFDLPDPGGAPTREVRIGQSLVSFPVWAFANPSTPGASVTVAFPAGYSVQVTGPLTGPVSGSGGTLVFRSGPLADPLSFFAQVVADRPGAYAEKPATTKVGDATVQLAVRSWSDDPAWGTRVADLFVRGLPAIAKAVGLPYPRTDRLVVQEAVTRSLGGYAGLFDPATGRIEVAYYASPFVVLHEAAHAWFNGALVADRWVDEAFASYYAEVAATALKVEVTPPKLTDALEKSRIPLNGWGAIGREDQATEAYAYAGSLALARLIADRAGVHLAEVWDAAAARRSAYQPAHPVAGADPETSPDVVDWRSLLDLLENATGTAFDDLWRTWVVRPEEASLLDARAAARDDYAATVRQAGSWELPQPVRQAMTAWQFEQARALLAQARGVLDRRPELERAASSAGLTLPGTIEQMFEGTAGFRAAAAEEDAEMAAIRTVAAAAAARPGAPDLVTQVGLFDQTPDATLADARTAFERGDLRTAVDRAESARNAWSSAAEIGRDRLIRLALGTVAGVLLLVLLVLQVRHRRRARRARAVD